MNPLLESTLSDIFNKYDSRNEKLLKYEKFKKIYEYSGKTITEGDFRQKLLKKFISKDDGLTIIGFKNYFYEQIKTLPEENIWNWLEALGYDRDFYSIESRLYFFSIHSESAIQVITRKNICGLEDQINVFLIQNHGVEIENKSGIKVLYYIYQDIHCYLYGICNYKDEGIEVNLDCSESENMVFSEDNGKIIKYVGSRDFAFMISALALPDAESFVRSARCTW